MGVRAAWKALWRADATRAASASGRPSWSRNGGGLAAWRTRRDRFDYAREVGDPRLNAVVAIACRWLKAQMPQAQFCVGSRQQDGTYAPNLVHPLLKILSRPNPFYSMRATWGGTVESFAVDGYAYWLKARDGVGVVREVYWIPNHQITVEPGTDRPIRGYWYDGANGREWREPRDVVHFRNGIDPQCPYQGLSELRAQLRNLAGLNSGERYASSILRKAHAGKVLVPKEVVGQVIEGTPEEQEMISLASKLERDTMGEEAGGFTHTNLPVELLDSGLGPEEMGLDRILDRPEALTVAAFGLNTLVLNLPSSDSTRTYSNKAEARREAWEDGVIPLQDTLADEIEAQLLYSAGGNGELLPEFGDGPGVFCWWDRKDVAALREDASERMNRASMSFSGGLARRDESRAMADLPPLGGELGEQILGAAPQPTKPPAGEEAGNEDDDQAEGDGDDPADAPDDEAGADEGQDDE
jgi:phage portal protein BeeE